MGVGVGVGKSMGSEQKQHVRPPKHFRLEFAKDGSYCPLVRHRNARKQKI